MAIHHASPGEVVDLEKWAVGLPREKSKAIFKTSEMEVARLVFKPGDRFPGNDLPGVVVIHCLSGCLEIESEGTINVILGGQLAYFRTVAPNTIKATQDSIILMTVVFHTND